MALEPAPASTTAGERASSWTTPCVGIGETTSDEDPHQRTMRTPTETSKKMDNPIANWRLALRSKAVMCSATPTLNWFRPKRVLGKSDSIERGPA